MPNGHSFDDYLLVVAEKIMSAVGVVAAGVVGWIFKTYRKDRAMLLKHDDDNKRFTSDLGLLMERYRATGGFQQAYEMIEAMNAKVCALEEEFDEWDAVSQSLGSKSDIIKEKLEELNVALARVANDVEWIKKQNERNK